MHFTLLLILKYINSEVYYLLLQRADKILENDDTFVFYIRYSLLPSRHISPYTASYEFSTIDLIQEKLLINTSHITIFIRYFVKSKEQIIETFAFWSDSSVPD